MKYELLKCNKYLDIEKSNKVSSLVAKAIEIYNISLDKDIKLNSPYKYDKMQELVGYLHMAINNKKKIVIYGDYDVDGICSVSILKRMFKLLNHEVGYYIPNRYKDGYGINCQKVEEIINKNYDIIICIDNGINAIEPIKMAKARGIEVIVLDHHEVSSSIPNCDFYLHPILSNFSTYNMCASSVAYYLSIAMLASSDDKCAILAGVATISDIMPLIDQNKLLVRNAIELLNKHKYKNFDILIDDNEYNENVLSMSLIPKLNSIGRIIKDTRVNSIVKFLFEEQENIMIDYSKFILECNEKRKLISNEFFNKIDTKNNNNIIIYKDDTLLEGVCGIVASRLANSFDVPAIIFAKSEDDKYYKGSARSVDGINIVEILNQLDYFVSCGGHEKAAGITINIEDYARFCNDINIIIQDIEKKESIKNVIEVFEDELTYKNYQELLKYGPFGEGNPIPLFGMDINKNLIGFSKDKKHIIIKLNNEVTLLGFNLANRYQEKYNNYRVIFTLDKNNLIKNKLSCKCIEIIGGIE